MNRRAKKQRRECTDTVDSGTRVSLAYDRMQCCQERGCNPNAVIQLEITPPFGAIHRALSTIPSRVLPLDENRPRTIRTCNSGPIFSWINSSSWSAVRKVVLVGPLPPRERVRGSGHRPKSERLCEDCYPFVHIVKRREVILEKLGSPLERVVVRAGRVDLRIEQTFYEIIRGQGIALHVQRYRRMSLKPVEVAKSRGGTMCIS